MATTIECPSCNHLIHNRAASCPMCGYRGDGQGLKEFLSSLTVVSSILVGFGLSGLLELRVNTKAHETIWDHCATGAWLTSSIVLLAVVMIASFVRRQVRELPIQSGRDQLDRPLHQCSCLFWAFIVGLFIMAVGIVSFGFSISHIHGYVGVFAVVVVVGSLLVLISLPPRRRFENDDRLED